MRSLAVMSLSLLFAVTSVNPSGAEMFADLYLGAAFPHAADFTVTALGVTEADTAATSTSFTAGGRLGYYFGTPGWLGVALDASFFKPDTDTTVVPVSLLVLLRAPLMSSTEFPHGRLQPYVGAGPAAFFTRESGTQEFSTNVSSASVVNVGVDVRGGITYLISRWIGLFVEYRYTRADTHIPQTINGIDVTSDFKLNTHHALGGVSFRF
jgi:opacity protein-like surface antigen